MGVHRSVVKWFDAKKGYGFVLHPDGGADVFVHYSQIMTEERFKTLRTGQIVVFDLHDGPKGVHAHNVMVVAEEEEPEEVLYTSNGMSAGMANLRNVFRAQRR